MVEVQEVRMQRTRNRIKQPPRNEKNLRYIQHRRLVMKSSDVLRRKQKSHILCAAASMGLPDQLRIYKHHAKQNTIYRCLIPMMLFI